MFKRRNKNKKSREMYLNADSAKENQEELEIKFKPEAGNLENADTRSREVSSINNPEDPEKVDIIINEMLHENLESDAKAQSPKKIENESKEETGGNILKQTREKNEINNSVKTSKKCVDNSESKEESETVSEEKFIRNKRMRKKPHGKGRWIVSAILICIAAIILTFGYSLWSEYSQKESVEGKEIEVTIKQGTSTKEVGTILKEAGVIRYETPFLIKMYRSEYKGKLRYGTFVLNDGMCLDDIIKTLSTGGALKEEASFTIPEGYSVAMIAEKLEEEGIMTKDEFLTAVKDAAADFSYAQILPAQDKVFYQLEGYLFPDTYYLSENMTGKELVDKILAEFNEKFDVEKQAEAEAAGMSVEEVLIRASLVQKETERPEEYATVAGVINNRIAKNMNLQFDSTVVYAISEGLYGVERVLYSHLKVDSPYNTYQNIGLPVGPICNPSLEAIDGVLHPEQHEYLYFQTDQTKNDGSNLYFKTYEEHMAAAATTQAP